MSICALKKATLFGPLTDKAIIVDQLQGLGLMHVVPLKRAPVEELINDHLAVAPESLRLALNYLLGCARKRHQVTRIEAFDLASVVAAVLKNHEREMQLSQQRDALSARIEDLEPWGDFALPAGDGLNGIRLWFYQLPNYRRHELERCTLPWSEVHRDNRYTYVVALNETEPAVNEMPVPRTHTGALSLNTLKLQRQDINIELDELHGEREALTRWIYLLERSLAGNDDAADREQVAAQTLDCDGIFALQGWIAVTDLPALEGYAEQTGLALMAQDPAVDENPPTQLANPPRVAGGEDLVRFYQMPGYRSWDPSRVVFFSFAIFFALILSDTGYGLLLALVIAFYWKRMGRTATGQRLRILGATLALCSVIWGVLVGSYFGATPDIGMVHALKLFDMNDFDSMMDISIYAGCVHLILGNLIAAWLARGSGKALPPLGWVLVIIASLMMWKLGVGAVTAAPGVLGLIMILLFSGSGRGPGLKNLGLRAVDGLLALTRVSSLFGDVLSYLRLFALGLASASLAITFNQMGHQVGASVPGIGLLLEALILIAGHLLNFVLAVASGVIHGLRLNLIEFYNWSLSDEGYLFQPFAKREVHPWIT